MDQHEVVGFSDWEASGQLWNQYLHQDELPANLADRVCNEAERLFFTDQYYATSKNHCSLVYNCFISVLKQTKRQNELWCHK